MAMLRKVLSGDGLSRAVQSDADKCDVRKMIDRARRGLGVRDLSGDQAVYADVSRIPDFHTMQNRIASAQQAFMRLPAVLRARFNNRPAELVAFLQDAKNKPEAIELGLIAKPVAPAPVLPEVPPKA